MNDRGHAQRSRGSEAESLPDDDPTGWFERLYVRAEAGQAIVPWARDEPNRLARIVHIVEVSRCARAR